MTLATQQFLKRALPAMRLVRELRPADDRRRPKVFERPFADMVEVRGRLNMPDREVLVEVESGRLRWAFNFATGDEKNFLRVYKPALEHRIRPDKPLVQTFDELVRKLFPKANFDAGAVDVIPGTVFQETFNVSHQKVRVLLDAGLILARETAAWRTGGSLAILLPSVIGFLKGRQMS